MRDLLRFVCCSIFALLIFETSLDAQDFRGRINRTVTDNTGAVMPGVTVTISSPALIQPQVPRDANRAPAVSIIDFRLDKSFRMHRTRLTAMFDAFNAANDGTVTAWRSTTVNYQEVTGILDPRVVRLGVKFNF